MHCKRSGWQFLGHEEDEGDHDGYEDDGEGAYNGFEEGEGDGMRRSGVKRRGMGVKR